MNRVLLEKTGTEGNRFYEEYTSIRVIKDDDGTLSFEVYQTTKPPLAKRAKNDYVIFKLSPDELAQLWEGKE